MYVWLKEEKTVFPCNIFWIHFSKRKINVLKNWLRDHSSWALYGIVIKIEGLLNSCLLNFTASSTLSLICSRIQGYMRYKTNFFQQLWGQNFTCTNSFLKTVPWWRGLERSSIVDWELMFLSFKVFFFFFFFFFLFF